MAYVAGLPIIATDRTSTTNAQNNGGADFDYGTDGSGFPNTITANANQFVAIWSGQFTAATAGSYTFDTASDDGSMLFIDGNVVVSNNNFQGVTTQTAPSPVYRTASSSRTIRAAAVIARTQMFKYLAGVSQRTSTRC